MGGEAVTHVTVCFLCLCFTLFVGRELSHVTVCFALFVGKEEVSRYGLLCFALLSFVLFCSCEGKAFTCYDLLCIALFRFALHSSVLLCIALLICGMTKKKLL